MPYTRNDWYVACAESDLVEGKPVAACILDEPMVLWRSGDKAVALEDRCVHRAAALSLGRCEGANLRCMYHGLLFNGAGVVVEIPGQDIIPSKARVRAFPVSTRYGFVWIWMGDPAKADPALLPEMFPGVDLNEFWIDRGFLDFNCESQLISDNLLDFSHIPYVHAESFEFPSEWAETTMKIEPHDRGVRFERWTENGRSGAFLFGKESADRVDVWLGYDYLIPGVLILWVGAFPKGTARSLNFARPDPSMAIEQIASNIQAITPIDERTSRYHFLVGLHRERGGNAEVAKKQVEVIVKAFNEDKIMIEAQQRVIDRDPARAMMPTVHDRGLTLYHRLKNRLVAREGQDLVPEADLARA